MTPVCRDCKKLVPVLVLDYVCRLILAHFQSPQGKFKRTAWKPPECWSYFFKLTVFVLLFTYLEQGLTDNKWPNPQHRFSVFGKVSLSCMMGGKRKHVCLILKIQFANNSLTPCIISQIPKFIWFFFLLIHNTHISSVLNQHINTWDTYQCSNI